MRSTVFSFRFLSLVLNYCVYCSSSPTGREISTGIVGVAQTVTALQQNNSKSRIYISSITKKVDELYDLVDANDDGMITFEEAYAGFLHLYVHLNRHAPIPPPSRHDALILFLHADKDSSNSLSREQFRTLLQRMVQRAFLRLTTHKVVTWLCAPILAEGIVWYLAERQESVELLVRLVVPSKYQDAVVSIAISRPFHRSLFMIILVTTLGNIFLNAINSVLAYTLPKISSSDKRLHNYQNV